MKKLSFSAKSIFMATALLTASITTVACGSENKDDTAGAEKKEAAAPAKAKKTPKGTPTDLNIRYIDGDSLNAHYNLAKDIQEQYLRSVSKLEAAQQSKAKELQQFASQIEQKMKTNQYSSEQAYNEDMAKFNQMQLSAQNYLAELERNAAQANVQQQQELLDSVNAFIQDYNAEKGYDAILFKAAGVFFNPSLDITDEVVDGLNARYKKK